MSHAQTSTNGLVIISLLAQPQRVVIDFWPIGSALNSEFNTIAHHFKMVRYKGQEAIVRHLSVYKLLPATSDYITYDGSMTQPGCQETVTWIIMNKPLYISIHHLKLMRELMQGSIDNPKAPISNNWRPSMPANYRPVRTNINFNSPEKQCTMKQMNFYQAKVLTTTKFFV